MKETKGRTHPARKKEEAVAPDEVESQIPPKLDQAVSDSLLKRAELEALQQWRDEETNNMLKSQVAAAEFEDDEMNKKVRAKIEGTDNSARSGASSTPSNLRGSSRQQRPQQQAKSQVAAAEFEDDEMNRKIRAKTSCTENSSRSVAGSTPGNLRGSSRKQPPQSSTCTTGATQKDSPKELMKIVADRASGEMTAAAAAESLGDDCCKKQGYNNNHRGEMTTSSEIGSSRCSFTTNQYYTILAGGKHCGETNHAGYGGST
ncbi:expressed unknown protein [Seminavis robusta]|uniref:Uncharacterized protein n=1 Tax=Seminavis robusta TaxID=568900 RepID=A0A9N8HVQ8_9STRA|nr:expressed unknown protein [Seminavis robusta]|eukprot:Sro1538_g280750.1 n/a (260) ;mRNA; r:4814-5679